MDPATNQTSTAATTTGAGATPPAGSEAGANGQQATTSQAAGASTPKTFSQEDVNRLVGQAREDGRQSALKKAAPEGQDQGKNGTPPNGGQTPAPPDVTALVNQAIATALQAAGADQFTILARSKGYSDAQVQLARAYHATAKPEDLGKWLDELPAQVGMQIKAQGQGAVGGTPPSMASPGGQPRKVEDMRDDHGLIDVFALAPEQVLSMGPAKIREEFEKARDKQRELSGAPPLPAALRRK